MGQALNEICQIEIDSNSQQADRGRHPAMLCIVEYLRSMNSYKKFYDASKVINAHKLYYINSIVSFIDVEKQESFEKNVYILF